MTKTDIKESPQDVCDYDRVAIVGVIKKILFPEVTDSSASSRFSGSTCLN